MQWIEITASTVEAAKQQALEHLGIAEDEAEFEVLAEPTKGLFGKMRGEARVRARVQPKGPRPKTERRDRRKRGKEQADQAADGSPGAKESTLSEQGEQGESDQRSERVEVAVPETESVESAEAAESVGPAAAAAAPRGGRPRTSRDERPPVDAADLEAQVASAREFVEGLVDAIGLAATTEVNVVEGDIEVDVEGDDLGLLIGPRGQVLVAVQELARVAAGREVDGRPARLRVDVSSYWRKRHEALARFAVKVAGEVAASGVARALEPMSAPDRKVVHDAVTGVPGVATRSEGEDPNRRVVIAPA